MTMIKHLHVVLALASVSTVAHADVVRRLLDPQGGGGGGGSAAAPTDPELEQLLAWAGEAKPAALPALLESAIAHEPTLASARIDLKIAAAQVMQTDARHDWHVAAVATGTKNTDYATGLAVDTRQYGGTADLSRVLPSGGTFDLHVGSQYSKYVEAMMPTTTVWVDTVSGTLTQPLLRGGGGDYYNAQARKAELTRDASVLARRAAAIAVVQAVITNYWSLVLAQRQLEITEQSLVNTRERLRVTEAGARVGKIADAEIPAVQQIIATRSEDALNNELAVLAASFALRRSAGMTIGQGALGLKLAAGLDAKEATIDLGGLIERAYAASPELAQLAKQEAGATIDIDLAENALLPQLDAALTVGEVGADPVGFGAAAKNLAELKSLAVTGTLTYSRSLGRHDTIGRELELRARREKVRVGEFDVRAQIAQTMARAVAQLQLAQRRVALSRRAIELARSNIKVETDRFNAGTRTNFDVLNRFEDLRQAELKEVQALIDWHKADVVVQALTGDILPAYGITVQ